MSDKPLEHWEHEILQQVDEKIEPIKHSLINLKQNQDKEIAKLQLELLATKRFIASLSINYSASRFISLIGKEKPKMYDSFLPKMTAATSAAFSKIDTSDDPLAIAGRFHNKWASYLASLGIPLVDLSDEHVAR